LRAIGSVLVLTNHFWHKALSSFVFSLGESGWIAMDSFFVLSGFLITGILLDSRARPDYFRSYYIRRSLRIFPLYYVVLAILIGMTALSWKGTQYTFFVQSWGSPFWFAAYLGNFKTAFVGRVAPIGGFGPLWSLQVEEQFYLLFPLLVRWLRPGQLSRLLWVLVFLSPVFRVLFYLHNPNNPFTQYELLPCHMEGLALGGLIAIRFRQGPWKIPKAALTALTICLLAATYIGSLLSHPTLEDQAWSSPFNRLLGYSLSSWGCACLVLWLIVFRDSSYTRWSRVAPLQYLGKISYGTYLMHLVALRCIQWTAHFGLHFRYDGFPRFAALMVLTLVLASVSWYIFEKPILSLKDRLAPSRKQKPLLAQV
jgi:peptidoglycan/LPS O-acetylase OafA/YrhL